MPTAPKFQRRIGGERGLPHPGLSVDTGTAFGGGPGEANARKARQGLFKVMDKMQFRADNLRLSEEQRAFDEWAHVNIYDKEKGAESRRGKNALGITEKVVGQFDEFARQRRGGLSNQRQEDAFQEFYLKRRNSLIQWANRKEAKEILEWEKGEYKAGVESLKQGMVENPDRVENDTEVIKEKVKHMGEMLGLGKEVIDQEIQVHINDVHARVISVMLAGNRPQEAREYFNEHKKEISPSVRGELGKRIDGLETKARAQKIVDKIFKEKFVISDSALLSLNQMGFVRDIGPSTFKEALDEGRRAAGDEPDLRGLVDSMVDKEWRIKEKNDKDIRESVFESVRRRLDETGSLTIEPHERPHLSTQQIGTLLQREKFWNLDESSGGFPKENDPKAVAELSGLTRSDVESFTHGSFYAKYGSRLNKTTYQKFEKLITDPGRRRGVLNENDRIMKAVREIGIGGITDSDTTDDISGSPEKAGALRLFRELYEDEVFEFEDRNFARKNPSPDAKEQQEILDGMVLRFTRKVGVHRSSGVPNPNIATFLDERFTAFELYGRSDDFLEDVLVDANEDAYRMIYNEAKSFGSIRKSVSFEDFLEDERLMINRVLLANDLGLSDEFTEDIIRRNR